MLALPRGSRQDKVSRASSRVIRPSTGQEETKTDHSSDSGRSFIVMDNDLVRVPSVELPPLPSSTVFNQDLDVEHERGIIIRCVRYGSAL